MTVVRLRGINQVKVKLADGRRATYYYAWKGGPRLPGQPGSPEFMAAYNEAVKGRFAAARSDTLSGLVALYRSKPEFKSLAPSTRKEWDRWLDRIKDHKIGRLPYGALDDRKVRSHLLNFRDEYADRPRTADYAMQVLSRVLSFGKDRGILGMNHAEGIAQLWESDRADQIWTAAELALYQAAAPSPEVGFIAPLACASGLRSGDLVALRWEHVGDLAIIKPTGKSRGRKNAVVPLTEDCRAILTRIKAWQAETHAVRAQRAAKRGIELPAPPFVLTNTRGRPWTSSGLSHAVIDVKALTGIDKHLHDARGTFGTRLRAAGLTGSEIADVLGWKEERVERLLATYVDRDTIVLALAERLKRNGSGAQTPK